MSSLAAQQPARPLESTCTIIHLTHSLCLTLDHVHHFNGARASPPMFDCAPTPNAAHPPPSSELYLPIPCTLHLPSASTYRHLQRHQLEALGFSLETLRRDLVHACRAITVGDSLSSEIMCKRAYCHLYMGIRVRQRREPCLRYTRVRTGTQKHSYPCQQDGARSTALFRRRPLVRSLDHPRTAYVDTVSQVDGRIDLARTQWAWPRGSIQAFPASAHRPRSQHWSRTRLRRGMFSALSYLLIRPPVPARPLAAPKATQETRIKKRTPAAVADSLAFSLLNFGTDSRRTREE
ncbi:hypothetical protein C8Q74DRAFT_157427 [Fomes fomentarius]|nr:hypothetical protein C8Q74DRAFT_157427 [Fomes fomentarius]